MDREKIKRRQSLKLIISETLMVLAVIATVVVLAFIVSGYWINSDFKVERQGLLQISSIPTGANVTIDQETSWLQRTNTSKVLVSGEHSIVLSKENYDTWSKTINISEGLLYRIHYPRLFLLNRTIERVYDVNGATFATVSPDRNDLLLTNNTTDWTIINLDRDKIESKTVNIAPYFSGVSVAEDADTGIFTDTIIDFDWSSDNTHVLFKVNHLDNTEWVLVDLNSPENSINISKTFDKTFSDVRILDNSANNLLVVDNQNLHKINISSKQISPIIASNVYFYDYYDNEIIFSARSSESDSFYIGLSKIDSDKSTRLKYLDKPARVAISKFYDDKYIVVLADQLLSIHQKEDFNETTNYDLSFIPQTLKIGHGGDFIVMSKENQIATLDLEAQSVSEWNVEGPKYNWLDDGMIYSVSNGDLIVYDFDGLNRRQLAKNVSSHFPVTISGDKWLYYFSDSQLVRERLIEN